MEHKLAETISRRLSKSSVIPVEYEEVYTYGLELIISSITSALIILSIGSIIRKIAVTIVFLSLFILLRRFTGGFHASTYLKCKICTVATYLAVVLLSSFNTASPLMYLPLLLIGGAAICIFAPIENPNKPLDQKTKKKCKILSLILFTVINAAGIIIWRFNNEISKAVFWSLVAIIALMMIEIIKRRKTA